MVLQHTALRDGGTRVARAWTCVAGHNIVPRAQQRVSILHTSTQAQHNTNTNTPLVETRLGG